MTEREALAQIAAGIVGAQATLMTVIKLPDKVLSSDKRLAAQTQLEIINNVSQDVIGVLQDTFGKDYSSFIVNEVQPLAHDFISQCMNKDEREEAK